MTVRNKSSLASEKGFPISVSNVPSVNDGAGSGVLGSVRLAELGNSCVVPRVVAKLHILHLKEWPMSAFFRVVPFAAFDAYLKKKLQHKSSPQLNSVSSYDGLQLMLEVVEANPMSREHRVTFGRGCRAGRIVTRHIHSAGLDGIAYLSSFSYYPGRLLNFDHFVWLYV